MKLQKNVPKYIMKILGLQIKVFISELYLFLNCIVSTDKTNTSIHQNRSNTNDELLSQFPRKYGTKIKS